MITARQYIARRHKLAHALQSINRNEFTMDAWENHCGTKHCALGLCPSLFPEHWTWSAKKRSWCVSRRPLLRLASTGDSIRDAERFFNLGVMVDRMSHALVIFSGELFVTPKQVAKELIKYSTHYSPTGW